jgi:hypothetical protein
MLPRWGGGQVLAKRRRGQASQPEHRHARRGFDGAKATALRARPAKWTARPAVGDRAVGVRTRVPTRSKRALGPISNDPSPQETLAWRREERASRSACRSSHETPRRDCCIHAPAATRTGPQGDGWTAPLGSRASEAAAAPSLPGWRNCRSVATARRLGGLRLESTVAGPCFQEREEFDRTAASLTGDGDRATIGAGDERPGVERPGSATSGSFNRSQ